MPARVDDPPPPVRPGPPARLPDPRGPAGRRRHRLRDLRPAARRRQADGRRSRSRPTRRAASATSRSPAFQSLLPLLSLIVEAIETRLTAKSLLEIYLGADAGRRVMGGLDPARRERHHRRRDLAVRPARLHRDEQPAAARRGAGDPQRLFRRGDAAGAGARRRDPEIHRRCRAGDLPDAGRSRPRRQMPHRADRGGGSAAKPCATSTSCAPAPARRRSASASASMPARSATATSASQTRLDFTVIGPAVNLAARITGLCRPLNQPLLASRPSPRPAAASWCRSATIPCTASTQPQEVYGLPEE